MIFIPWPLSIQRIISPGFLVRDICLFLFVFSANAPRFSVSALATPRAFSFILSHLIFLIFIPAEPVPVAENPFFVDQPNHPPQHQSPSPLPLPSFTASPDPSGFDKHSREVSPSLPDKKRVRMALQDTLPATQKGKGRKRPKPPAAPLSTRRSNRKSSLNKGKGKKRASPPVTSSSQLPPHPIQGLGTALAINPLAKFTPYELKQVKKMYALAKPFPDAISSQDLLALDSIPQVYTLLLFFCSR